MLVQVLPNGPTVKTWTERKTEGKTEKLQTPVAPCYKHLHLDLGWLVFCFYELGHLKHLGMEVYAKRYKRRIESQRCDRGHLNDPMLGEMLPPSAFPLVGWGPHGSLALQDYVAGSIRESMGKNHGLLITKSFTSCETCSHLLCSISFIKGKKSTSCTQSPVYLNIQRPNFLHKKLCAYPSVQELPITWGPFY